MLVKICGITNPDDARWVQRCGADFLGLVFVPRSKRYVSVSQANQVLEATTGHTQPVGVFQNHDRQEVEDIANNLGLEFLQLHGQEGPEYVNQLARDLPESRFLKAIAYTGRESLDTTLSWYQQLDDPDRLLAVLLDGPWGGGAGVTFDWSELAEAIRSPRYGTVRKKIILAGGLSSQNVRQAITMLHPIGVDVSNGVEICPGKKDPTKVERFVVLAKSVGKD